ncbi:MAG: hypothetical protein LJE65_07860, partial [Desulfobacteraceae bacterium]|nr:hypothetical protein [Desulfobacteraceae bacterium]
ADGITYPERAGINPAPTKSKKRPFQSEHTFDKCSKLSFGPISVSGPRFQSSKYGSIPAADNSDPH